MIEPKFHYNPKTCQYEQAKLRWVDLVGYVAGTALTGFAFFVILSILSDRLIESDEESALRLENQVLEKHKLVLTNQLVETESALVQLREKDQELASTLFATILPQIDKTRTQKNHTDILLAGASGFQSTMDALLLQSSSLAKKSNQTKSYSAVHSFITGKDRDFIRSIPTFHPVENMSVEKVSSGFGMRINPFHKGIYNHPGLDIVSLRGTPVLAAAQGIVHGIKRSDLQAGYGNYIEIDHGNGFVTRYAHLEDILIKSGQRVSKGMVIGTVGNSGGSIAPHLHYEVLHHGKNENPVHYIVEGLSSGDHQKLVMLSKKQNQSLD